MTLTDTTTALVMSHIPPDDAWLDYCDECKVYESLSPALSYIETELSGLSSRFFDTKMIEHVDKLNDMLQPMLEQCKSSCPPKSASERSQSYGIIPSCWKCQVLLYTLRNELGKEKGTITLIQNWAKKNICEGILFKINCYKFVEEDLPRSIQENIVNQDPLAMCVRLEACKKF